MISNTPPFVLRFSKDERKVFSRIKYQFDLASVNGRFRRRRLFQTRPLVPQYEISDCGMIIEIELRQFRIEALITLDPSYGSINSPSRGRSRDSQLI
jgi:hypothetical protein